MSIKGTGRFSDGPLDGLNAHCEYAPPVMVRAVGGAPGARILAGDDAPPPGMAVYVYIASRISTGFWDGRNAKNQRVGGQMYMVTYKLFEPQPAAEVMATGPAWRAWTDANKQALLAEHKRLVGAE